jgi:hypothetical protein
MRLTLLLQPQHDAQLQLNWTQTIQISLWTPLLQNLLHQTNFSVLWSLYTQPVTHGGPGRQNATPLTPALPLSLIPRPVRLSDRAAASKKSQFRRYMDVTNQIIIKSQQQQPPACTPFDGNSASTSVQSLQGLHICSQRPL